MTGPGEGVNRERLPVFRTFEERAVEAGIPGLNTAVRSSAYPENTWDVNESGGILLWMAGPYASLMREEVRLEATQAAYNGIHFASGIASYLMGSRNLPLYPFDNTQTRQTIRQQIAEIQQTYLAERPTLEDWLDIYIASIDPSGLQHDIIRTVYSVTLKQLEEKDHQEFIDLETRFLTDGLE